MKKILVMALATLLGCSLSAQDSNVIELINNKGSIEPMRDSWLIEETMAERTPELLRNLTKSDLKTVSEMMDAEIARMDNILQTRDIIIGKETKAARIEKKLKKHFKDPAVAMKCFEQAESIKNRAQMVQSIANACYGEQYHQMPKTDLKLFSYSSGNGFAGWRSSVELKRNADGNGGTLTYKEENIHRAPIEGQENENKPEQVNVDDSVFVKVYDLIKETQLYDEQNNYQPLYDVTDGTNWSLWMSFEGTYISTGGYMSGPNHYKGLNQILAYLKNLFGQPKAKE